METRVNKKGVISVIVFFIVLVFLFICFFSLLFTKEYSIKDLQKSLKFDNYTFENWKEYKGHTFVFEGYLYEKSEDSLTIKMDGRTMKEEAISYYVVLERDNEIGYADFAESWDILTKQDYIIVIGELKKVKDNFFNDNVICLGRWYYDSTDVESYYLDLEKEEELRKEKEKQKEEELLLQQQSDEFNAILVKIEKTSVEVDTISVFVGYKLELEQFAIKYPTFATTDEYKTAFSSLETVINNLKAEKELKAKEAEEEKRLLEEQIKEREERRKAMDMTPLSIRDGYTELDAILDGLAVEIVSSDNSQRFRSLCRAIGYYEDTNLQPGQATQIADELYSIIRKPTDTTELNKLIDRFDFFIERCPNFSKDDDLNHRYEVIALILRGLNK